MFFNYIFFIGGFYLTIFAIIIETKNFGSALFFKILPFFFGSCMIIFSMKQFSIDRKSTRLNSSHVSESRMPSSA